MGKEGWRGDENVREGGKRPKPYLPCAGIPKVARGAANLKWADSGRGNITKGKSVKGKFPQGKGDLYTKESRSGAEVQHRDQEQNAPGEAGEEGRPSEHRSGGGKGPCQYIWGTPLVSII